MHPTDVDVTHISEPGSVEFSWHGHELFVVRWQGLIRVYKNACPHIGISLNFMPDQFFDPEKSFIICANHGALFRIEDGLCESGPCYREHLLQVPHEIREGWLWIDSSGLGS